MALADLRTKTMPDASVTAAVDPSWLGGAVRYVVDGLGIGGLGALGVAVWRAGGRVALIEAKQEAQDKINEKVGARLDSHEATHNRLEVAVAALPKRDEVLHLFGELRQDIRDLKP